MPEPTDTAPTATTGSSRRPSLSVAAGTARGPRGGPGTAILWSSVWLVYLVPGVLELVRGEHGADARWIGPPGLALFVGLYVWLMLRAWRPAVTGPRAAAGAREGRGRGLRDTDPVAARLLACCAVLSIGLTLAFGGGTASSLVFLAPAAASVLSGAPAVACIVAAAVLAGGHGLLGGAPDDGVFAAFPTLMAGFIVLGVRHMRSVIDELDATREEVRRLAATEERARLGRDLHDLLGHGLTVIAVKSQLAGRLLERGEDERAAVEVAELGEVAQTALREVREVVTGYRPRPLATELAAARSALTGAGVTPEVGAVSIALPALAEDVLGFVVREGVTNVLRHGRATACAVELSAAPGGGVLLEVRDDGVGPAAGTVLRQVDPRADARAGNGLRGLAERLAEVDGRLEAGPGAEGGHVLRAHVPGAPGEASVPVPADGTAMGSTPALAGDHGAAGAPPSDAADRSARRGDRGEEPRPAPRTAPAARDPEAVR